MKTNKEIKMLLMTILDNHDWIDWDVSAEATETTNKDSDDGFRYFEPGDTLTISISVKRK